MTSSTLEYLLSAREELTRKIVNAETKEAKFVKGNKYRKMVYGQVDELNREIVKLRYS